MHTLRFGSLRSDLCLAIRFAIRCAIHYAIRCAIHYAIHYAIRFAHIWVAQYIYTNATRKLVYTVQLKYELASSYIREANSWVRVYGLVTLGGVRHLSPILRQREGIWHDKWGRLRRNWGLSPHTLGHIFVKHLAPLGCVRPCVPNSPPVETHIVPLRAVFLLLNLIG